MALTATVILPRAPDREGGAADRCAVGLLQGLSAHGIELEVVAADETFHRRRLDNLRRPHSGLASPSTVERVARAAARSDVVHVEQVEAGWLAQDLRLPTSLHVLYRSKLDLDLDRPWTRRFRTSVEARRTERMMIRRHHHLVANSATVAATLRREAVPGTTVTVVPLTLDPQGYPPVEPAGRDPVVGIIGTASWPPTANALDRLVRRVWPEVHRLHPESRLRVAGRGTHRWAESHSDVPGLEVLGPVASATAFLASLDVLLYPLERGSGMKVKVLESLAMGLPVVTTSRGAEGFVSNEGIIVDEDDEVLVRATAELLRDPLARQQRGEAGRRTFSEYYSPLPATAPLAELLRHLAAD